MSEQMPDVSGILKELTEKGMIPGGELSLHPMKGTTSGHVYSVSVDNQPSYVLKLDHPRSNGPVANFLNAYRHTPLLPELVYADPSNAFLVYTYISGITHYQRGAKRDWLARLVQDLLNYYEPAQAPGQWGFLDDPAASWKDFIEGGIKEARTNVGSFLPAEDYRLVSSQVALTPAISDPGRAYLLHGDCGVHNLVFHQSRLAGIIDPCPAAGPILYDLVYAFCSSPDDLDTDTLLEAFGLLQHPPVEPVQLFREVLVQLYCRIGTCLLHHPHDLPGYLTAWEYWKKQVE